MLFIGFALAERIFLVKVWPNMRKIDIHCHTTRSCLKNIIPPSATLETIEKEMRKHDIDCTIVLATYFPKEGRGVSNYRLLHWIKENTAFRLFGSLDFQHYFAAGMRELTELAEAGSLYGIKIYSGYQEIDYNSDKFQRIAKLAEEHCLPLMFHGGFLQCHESNKTLAVSPKQFKNVAHDFPEIPIIISHLAWPFVDELIDVVLRYENVFADMSGMLDSFKTSHKLPECIEGLKRYLGACGPERLLFGTDFPVQTHSDSVKLVELAMVDYSDTDRQCVYYSNSKSLLNLSEMQEIS